LQCFTLHYCVIAGSRAGAPSKVWDTPQKIGIWLPRRRVAEKFGDAIK
jgi:hypothetical protein